MTGFLLYEGKAAIVLLVFYLFYRFLLRKETFHRFNRVVLVGTAVLSSLLPLCIITIHKPAEFQVQVMEPDAGAADSRVLPAVQDYSQESALDSVHATGNLSGRGESQDFFDGSLGGRGQDFSLRGFFIMNFSSLPW